MLRPTAGTQGMESALADGQEDMARSQIEFFHFSVYGCFACMCDWLPRAYNDCRGQKVVSDSLEPELQTVFSHNVGAENQIRVL